MQSYETLVAHYAEHYRSDAKALAQVLLQSGTSKSGIDVLAHMASRGRLHSDGIIQTFIELQPVDIDKFDHEALAWFALVVGVRAEDPKPRAARVIIEALMEHFSVQDLPEQVVRVFLQLSLESSRKIVLDILPQSQIRDDEKNALDVDAHNPFLFPDLHLNQGTWLQKLGHFTDPENETELKLIPGTAHPFYRLTSINLPHIHNGPKITVVTSAYNPDAALINTTRSLIEQTWQNWEMLIVDDASTSDDAESYLRAAAILDPRVRIIRMPVNGGTYLARNTAMAQARGEFITFLDSDDWAHPRRLELGIRPLLALPYLAATYSHGSRVSADLRITRVLRSNRGPSANSLMFRISDVMNTIGFFDTTRKAADNEYLKRLESTFGADTVYRVPLVGTLSLDGDTLSASDFHAGWRHPARTLYRTSYATLHNRTMRTKASPYVEHGRRSPHFGIQLWQKPGDINYQHGKELDVVIAGDWYSSGGPQTSMIGEIRSLLGEGLAIGVTDFRPIRAGMARKQVLDERLTELLLSGQVQYVFPEEERDVTTFILRYPPLMQFPSLSYSRLNIEHFLIVANQAPSEPDGSDQRYIPCDVDRNIEKIFGLRPLWVPQGPAIRTILQEHSDKIELADWDMPTVADPIAADASYPSCTPIVVGRHSRDDVIKFPADPNDFFKAYAFPDSFRILMLGAENYANRAMTRTGRQELPKNWEVMPVRGMEVSHFLNQIDVFVYFDNENANEAFCRVILEAAAAGKLVVTSRKHEKTFGDAVVYATPATAVSVVEKYLQDRDSFERQIARSLQRVRERWSGRAFIEAVRGKYPSEVASRSSSSPPKISER